MAASVLIIPTWTAAVLLATACSGNKKQSPVAVVADAAVDSSAPVDGRPPFAVERKTSSVGSSIGLRLHDAACPAIEWRAQAKTIRIARCRDKPLAEQTADLRDMVAYLRTLETIDDASLRIVGIGDYESYPELGRRFVTYARTHPYTPKVGLHRWIKQAANSGDMMPELAVIFQRKPILSSVEKCWSGRASNPTDEGRFIREAGGSGKAEIPLGCAMTVFALAPP